VYYHVRLSVKGQRHDEIKVDVDEETLERQFLAPYRSGTPITVNGKSIPIDQVERLRISTSDVPTSQIIPILRDGDARSNVAVIGGPSYTWRAAARATNVTDQFITGPPGEQKRPSVTDAQGTTSQEVEGGIVDLIGRDRKGVFLVAGRDNEAASAVKYILRALGLRIVEWEHAVAKTGLPTPYVGDVVEEGLRMADVAVVLLTPDDLVQLRKDLLRDEDGSDEREQLGQARPNVYYEAGIADAIGRHRTVIVEIGPVKSFSDSAGRHVVRYDGSPAKRNALAERLRIAGVEPDTSGSDWLSVGDVESAVKNAKDALDAASKESPKPSEDESD